MRNSDVPPHSGRVASPARPKEKEKGDDETIDDRQPGSQTTPRAPRGTGWTGMLDGTSRPTNPENEPNGIHQEN